MIPRPALALALALASGLAGAPLAAEIVGARYAAPTTRYDHGVLGDAVEYGALVLKRRGAPDLRITLPETRVFEDTAPRLADLDGDGAREVVVVESDLQLGARLAVYDATGLRMATPFIGMRYRWLAPVAVADLDGDGAVEIAYVDRPHLAKTLRIWRVRSGALVPVAQMAGLSNHRIGERDISGGLRDCGEGPELVLADGAWRQVMAVRLAGGRLSGRAIGPYRGPASFESTLACAR